MYVHKVSPYIRNGCLNRYIIGKIVCLLPRVVIGLTRVSIILLQYTYSLSMSIRQSRKGVFTFTMWKLTRPIRVLTITNLINTVKLMLNQMFTALVYIILISVLLFIVALYIRYCPQPAVDFLETPMLIITLQNSLGVQRSMVIYANGSYSQSVISITGVLTEQFLGIIKCVKKQSANMVVILKAWLSVKDPKVVRNVSKVSCS